MGTSNRLRQLVARLTAGTFTVALVRPAVASGDPPPAAVTLTLRSDAPGTRLQRLAGTADITLGRHAGSAELWNDLCVAPCDAAVARRDRLRVAGDAIETAALELRPDQDHASVFIQAGSKTKRDVGLGLSVFGFAAALTGASLLGAAAVVDPPSSGPLADPAFGTINAQRADQANSLRTIGIIALVAGGLGLLIGLPTFAANRTEIRFE